MPEKSRGEHSQVTEGFSVPEIKLCIGDQCLRKLLKIY